MEKKARRGRGDGALYRRGDGYWVGGVELTPAADGTRRYKRVVRKSRNDCVNALRDLKRDAAAGLVVAGKSPTVAAWLDYWESDILPHRNIVPGTMLSYRNMIKNHLKPRLGTKRIDKLAPRDIRELYTALTDEISGRTAQKADQVLRLALAAAVRDGVLGVSVMDRVDKPAHTAKDGVAFPATTSMHIIETAVKTSGQMWGARWALGFTTGARECEILGLEWDRVDLDRNLIEVSWQLRRQQMTHGCGKAVDGKYPCGKVRSSFCPQAHWKFPAGMTHRECTGTLVWTRPKTKAGLRVIPLVPEMADVLRRLREADKVNPHGLVLHNPDGSPISQDQDQKAWKKLLVAANVRHAPQHSVRHSTATLLLEAGVDVHIVQSVIGHSDIAMTRRYQHVNMELARQAWSNLNTLLPCDQTVNDPPAVALGG